VCWQSCSSCWNFHLLREVFLSAPIHSPPPLVRRIGPSKMTLQFERKYTTHGSGAPCHVSFGFFSGFFGIILQKLQMDPQPESRTQPKARGLLHMECDFAIALPYQLRLQDNTGIVEDLQEQHSRTLGTTWEDFRITQISAEVDSSLGMLQIFLRTFGL
jgi:hypothetical protein